MIAFLLGLCLLASDAPDVSLVVDPPSGEVGLVMSVILTVSGPTGADCDLQPLPAVEGARLSLGSGPSTQQSMVVDNGRVSRSIRTRWELTLIPERAGTIELPPLRLNCRGEEVATAPVLVPVRETELAQDMLGLELAVSTDALWVGQIFSIDVRAWLGQKAYDNLVQDGVELSLPWLDDFPGAMLLDSPPPAPQPVAVSVNSGSQQLAMRLSQETAPDGERRYLLSRSLRLLATSPGVVRLPEGRFSARIATQVRHENDPFDIFGRARNVVTRSVVIDARAPGPKLTVKDPPADGRPASYTNAVGRFRLTGTAAPRSLQVGETCQLALELSGEGNLEFVEWPAFAVLEEDFRIFGKDEADRNGVRVLELEISPKNERVSAIPALELAAFDPASERYEVLAVEPMPLQVQPGGEGGLVALESDQEILNDLHTIREELPPAGGRPVPGWALWSPALLLLLLVEVRGRRAAWRLAHPRLVARAASRPALDAALARATHTRDVAVAFGKFLAARLGGPPAGLSGEEAAAILSGQDAALAEAVRVTVADWEAAWLGGAALPLERAVQDAQELADRMESLP